MRHQDGLWNAIWSDVFNISILLRLTLLHRNIQEVDWSFFGTAHGKGPVDGVGGTVRRILQGKVTISS